MSEPAGIIMPFAGTVAPENYLFCDGSAVSRSTYATLFDVIGTTFGAGDGSSTFNLPDLSGRVPLGVSQAHALGTTGGSETVTLTESELPAHVHEVPQHGHENTILAKTPSLSHTITAQPAFNYTNAKFGMESSTGYSHTLVDGSSSTNASRSTSVSITAHAATDCTMSGTIGNSSNLTSGADGGDGAHNNMQPFSVLNYIICIGE
jgi:microcystin-dependent protein